MIEAYLRGTIISPKILGSGSFTRTFHVWPVVVWMMTVSQPGVVSSRLIDSIKTIFPAWYEKCLRMVFWCCHANVPFSRNVCRVVCPLQNLSHSCHIGWNACWCQTYTRNAVATFLVFFTVESDAEVYKETQLCLWFQGFMCVFINHTVCDKF